MIVSLDSVDDLFNLDLGDISLERERIVEGEIDEYSSFIYNRDTQQYSIRFMNKEDDYEEEEIYLEDTIEEDLEINGITISDRDYQEFRNLINSNNY